MNWLSDDAVSRLQAASALPDLAGTRYRIIQRIGSGGMGAVYLAEDAVLERRVALKILDVPDAAGELAVRLLREAHVLAQLEHPGIVPVHDAGTLSDGRVFYAMKFVEGQRLDRLIVSMGALSDRMRVFQRICDAVAFAHARGILHRDLKPDNIMIGPFGEVLVMDWGIAKILNQTAEIAAGLEEKANSTCAPGTVKTGHGTILGTPGYMSPEQARGEVENLDERGDIYSLGAILQFLLTSPPPTAEQLTTAEKDGLPRKASIALAAAPSSAPRPLTAIAHKAMAPEPAARYATASKLDQDVAHFLDGLPVSAYPENIFQKVARWGSRYQLAIVLVLTYLILRAILLLWLRR
jgi:eukaryotic-like serine/threonine-protein kinase